MNGCLLLPTCLKPLSIQPFELVFGHPSSLPSALKSEPSPQYNCDDYVSELKECLQSVYHVAKKYLVASKVQSKDYYDKGM
jgi:hypothetical protein